LLHEGFLGVQNTGHVVNQEDGSWHVRGFEEPDFLTLSVLVDIEIRLGEMRQGPVIRILHDGFDCNDRNIDANPEDRILSLSGEYESQ
jgi:hypothetical protein